MNYTIARLIKDNLILSIDNHYKVLLYNTDTKELTYKEFTTIDHGFKAFSLVSEVIIKSLFNEHDKRELLKASHYITSLDQFKQYLRALEEATTLHPEDLQAATDKYQSIRKEA